MSDTILEAKELHYYYPDGVHALKGVSLKIKRGKTTAILGGNGAGKSTFFLNCNGILKPTSGELFYKDMKVDFSPKSLNELRRSVGLVFQNPDSQLFSANVYQDVSFGAMNLKLPEVEIRHRVDVALERTGIMHLKEKPTHYLSFGQKKRAALAGVLVMEPEVLVLDEPTAGLDPKGAGEIMKFLKEIREQLGISVVIATHDIDIVPLYSDYVYVMDQGEIILQGTPKEVFREAEILRKVHLRLPRIAHLFEILQKKDKFSCENNPTTISEARKIINQWRRSSIIDK